MITFKTLRYTDPKDKLIKNQFCDNICIICGYHTHEENKDGVRIHNFCMNEYSKYCRELQKEKSCCMCGSTTRKLIENTCSKCLKGVFN